MSKRPSQNRKPSPKGSFYPSIHESILERYHDDDGDSPSQSQPPSSRLPSQNPASRRFFSSNKQDESHYDDSEPEPEEPAPRPSYQEPAFQLPRRLVTPAEAREAREARENAIPLYNQPLFPFPRPRNEPFRKVSRLPRYDIKNMPPPDGFRRPQPPLAATGMLLQIRPSENRDRLPPQVPGIFSQPPQQLPFGLRPPRRNPLGFDRGMTAGCCPFCVPSRLCPGCRNCN